MSGEWITTYTGISFYHSDPKPYMVCIEDIAHALSLLCRFAGHCSKFYSVAEHCVRASYLCPEKDQLWALLHDASETYCVDIPRPLKRAPGMEKYRHYEDLCQEAVVSRFGLSVIEPLSVHKADVRMLYTEKRDLMPDVPWEFSETVEPLPESIEPWTSEEAKRKFITRFYELTGTREFYKQEKYEEIFAPISLAVDDIPSGCTADSKL